MSFKNCLNWGRKPYRSELKAVEQVLKSGVLSGYRANWGYHYGGEYVQRLEKDFQDYFHVKHALAVSSATAGLFLALKAYGIKEGDEVITTPYTFSASASCILMVGATPVFADIEAHTFNLNPLKVLLKVTDRTKAIIAVHLHGQSCDMDVLKNITNSCNLYLVEDAAQSLGATYRGQLAGTIGDIGVFSFNQWKPINSGEGGMVVTNNDSLAEAISLMRNHGEVYSNKPILGYNFRMTEITAAIALERFKNVDKVNNETIKLCEYMTQRIYDRFTPELLPPYVMPDCKHTYYTYPIRLSNKVNRKELQGQMLAQGTYMGGDYVKPLHLLPIFGGHEGEFPVAERMWSKEIMVTNVVKSPLQLKSIDDIIKKIGIALS